MTVATLEPAVGAVTAGGLTWRVRSAGPPVGQPVLLLHGFPEDHRSWDAQMGPLARAGYRAVAADLPGIGGTEPPPGYRIEAVAPAIVALSLELDPRGSHLVGHDWGSILACAAASLRPDAFRSLTAVAGPHPDTFADGARDVRQLARSWYVGAFLVPGADAVLSWRAGMPAYRLIPGRARLRTRREIRNALGYYRENLAPWNLSRFRLGRVPVPALVVHAARDRYVGIELALATGRRCDDLRRLAVIDSGHFVHQERPEEFNEALLAFLGSVAANGEGRRQSST